MASSVSSSILLLTEFSHACRESLDLDLDLDYNHMLQFVCHHAELHVKDVNVCMLAIDCILSIFTATGCRDRCRDLVSSHDVSKFLATFFETHGLAQAPASLKTGSLAVPAGDGREVHVIVDNVCGLTEPLPAPKVLAILVLMSCEKFPPWIVVAASTEVFRVCEHHEWNPEVGEALVQLASRASTDTLHLMTEEVAVKWADLVLGAMSRHGSSVAGFTALKNLSVCLGVAQRLARRLQVILSLMTLSGSSAALSVLDVCVMQDAAGAAAYGRFLLGSVLSCVEQNKTDGRIVRLALSIFQSIAAESSTIMFDWALARDLAMNALRDLFHDAECVVTALQLLIVLSRFGLEAEPPRSCCSFMSDVIRRYMSDPSIMKVALEFLVATKSVGPGPLLAQLAETYGSTKNQAMTLLAFRALASLEHKSESTPLVEWPGVAALTSMFQLGAWVGPREALVGLWHSFGGVVMDAADELDVHECVFSLMRLLDEDKTPPRQSVLISMAFLKALLPVQVASDGVTLEMSPNCRHAAFSVSGWVEDVVVKFCHPSDHDQFTFGFQLLECVNAGRKPTSPSSLRCRDFAKSQLAKFAQLPSSSVEPYWDAIAGYLWSLGERSTVSQEMSNRFVYNFSRFTCEDLMSRVHRLVIADPVLSKFVAEILMRVEASTSEDFSASTLALVSLYLDALKITGGSSVMIYMPHAFSNRILFRLGLRLLRRADDPAVRPVFVKYLGSKVCMLGVIDEAWGRQSFDDILLPFLAWVLEFAPSDDDILSVVLVQTKSTFVEQHFSGFQCPEKLLKALVPLCERVIARCEVSSSVKLIVAVNSFLTSCLRRMDHPAFLKWMASIGTVVTEGTMKHPLVLSSTLEYLNAVLTRLGSDVSLPGELANRELLRVACAVATAVDTAVDDGDDTSNLVTEKDKVAVSLFSFLVNARIRRYFTDMAELDEFVHAFVYKSVVKSRTLDSRLLGATVEFLTAVVTTEYEPSPLVSRLMQTCLKTAIRASLDLPAEPSVARRTLESFSVASRKYFTRAKIPELVGVVEMYQLALNGASPPLFHCLRRELFRKTKALTI